MIAALVRDCRRGNGSPEVFHSNEIRIAWLDTLRIVAALGVVCLHVSNVVIQQADATSTDWWVGNLACSFFAWCVPVFVMISGALVLPKAASSSVGDFYRRRFGRLAVPVILWSLFFLGWTWYRGGFTDLRGPAEAMLLGRPFYHLWFLFALLGLYVVAPFLAVFLAAAKTERAWAAVIIGFLIFSLQSGVAAFRGWRADIFIMWVPYVPYFLAGYLLVHRERPLLSGRISAISFIVSVVLFASLTGLLTPRLGTLAWRIMYRNLNPLVIISSVAVVCFAHSAQAPWFHSNTIRRAATLMLGVYIIHPLWILVVQQLGISADRMPAMVGIPLCTTVVFSLSLATSWLIACVPFGKRLVT
jgi:surface polysaccharide O-acyltransferase-like enzyme